MPEIRYSIVITCHNQLGFIRDAVESALSQTPGLSEIIVVDDGSTDGSGEILEQYSNSIQLFRFPSNRGAIEARNYGAAQAKGEYLVTLDGDDVLMPWALAVYERIIQERHPKILIGQAVSFEGAGAPAPDEDAPHSIEFVEYDALMHRDRAVAFCGSTCVFERRTFESVGGWTPGIFYGDVVDLFSKLGYSGRTILVCSPATVFYRIHSSNSIHALLPFIQTDHLLMAKERRGEYPGGRRHIFERRSWFGRTTLYSVRRALRAGFYMEAVKLVASGWTMILAAILRKIITSIKGRRPVRKLGFQLTPELTRTAVYR